MSGKTGQGDVVFATEPHLINPVVGTQSSGDNSTKAASTAYVDAAAGAISHLVPANNLSDVVSAATSRTNLGLGTAATHPSGDFLLTANNLSDVTAATGRSNLSAAAKAQVDIFYMPIANANTSHDFIVIFSPGFAGTLTLFGASQVGTGSTSITYTGKLNGSAITSASVALVNTTNGTAAISQSFGSTDTIAVALSGTLTGLTDTLVMFQYTRTLA